MARTWYALIGFALIASCADDELGALEARASMYQRLHKLTAQPFATAQHQGNPLVDVWGDDRAAAPYRALSSGAIDVEFPEGAMIVKEMLDPAGTILTVMIKQPPGFDTANQDWWYGRLDADGRATSASVTGKVGFCIACHRGAAAGGYVFGIAAENLSAAGSADR